MRAPGTTSCMRLRHRMKVDLPQPEGPMMAVTCRGLIFMLMLFKTYLGPNQASTLTASMPCEGSTAGSEDCGAGVGEGMGISVSDSNMVSISLSSIMRPPELVFASIGAPRRLSPIQAGAGQAQPPKPGGASPHTGRRHR